MINGPFGYNYDIQPFHPCSVLQGGGGGETTWQKNWDCGCDVVFQKHGRQTTLTAEEPRTDSFIVKDCVCAVSSAIICWPCCLSSLCYRGLGVKIMIILSGERCFFSTDFNIRLNILMPIIMADKYRGFVAQGGWFPSVGSPCFWLPLSLHSGTHFLDKTRGYRLPMPVNGSLCNYDYVQPCAPGTGLNHRTTACFQSRKNT